MSEPESEIHSLGLEKLLLDPNNIRLVDDPLWKPVDEAEIASRDIQDQTTARLQQEDSADFYSLLESIRQFGWLDVEPVRVRMHGAGGFVVTDGNRRVVALRELYGIGRTQQVSLFTADPPDIRVVVESEPDGRSALLAHALRHTEDRQTWSSFSAAIWRSRHPGVWPSQHHSRGPRGIGRRTLAREDLALELCVRYRHSPWGDEFQPRLFVLFEQALHEPRIQKWLGVSLEGDVNSQNLDRFFSWISENSLSRTRSDGDSDEHVDTPGLGHKRGKSVIHNARDLRRLASILTDARALEQIDLDRDLDAAVRVRESDLFFRASSDVLRQSLELWQQPAGQVLSPDMIESAQKTLVSLRQIIATAGEQPVAPASEIPWPIAASVSAPHLSSLQIDHYRGLTGVSLDGFAQVNLLVGVNNAGKTSVLESIYLLSRQSDPRGLLDTLRARVRADPEARPEWLVRLLPQDLRIEGAIAGGSIVDVRHTVSDRPASTDANLASFLATLRIDSRIASMAHVSTTEFYANRPRRTQAQAGSQVWMAPALLHSPFSLSDRATLVNCYERSIEEGTKPKIIDFIRAHVDVGVEDIELANTDGRFMVQHRNNGPLDLSFYGEGMQRIFEVSLLFAAHARGILLIDEFENALHTSVLLGFSRMVQELANDFEVQVFLSTHSKETVDAFILNDFRTDDVVAFALRRDGEGLKVDRFAGPSLLKAIESVDVDIRRI